MAKGLSFLYENEHAKAIEPKSKPLALIPSPSPQLNWALHGGVPMGYIVRFMGQPSSGKTLQAILIAAEFQRRFPDGVVILGDFEQSFQREWYEGLGVDTSKGKFLHYTNPSNSGAEFFDWLQDTVLPGLIEAEKRALILVDSVDTMVAPKEEGRSFSEFEMAPMAAFLPKVLRRIMGPLQQSGSTLLVINQVRANPGQLYGNPETTSGGNALKHASVLDVHFAQILKKEDYVYDVAKQRVGHKVRFKIPKNKISPPYRDGTYTILYTKGVINRESELAELAKRLNVIERPNNRTYVLEGTTYNGFENFATALKDPKLFKLVEERCRDYQSKQAGTAPIESE